MANPSRKPVSLDLDALEREDDPGRFTFNLGGSTYEMRDPQTMDYRELLAVLQGAQANDLVASVTGLLDPDEAAAFWENKLAAFKLNVLLENWLEHYGLKPGEASASSPSSNGTARPSKRTSRSGR